MKKKLVRKSFRIRLKLRRDSSKKSRMHRSTMMKVTQKKKPTQKRLRKTLKKVELAEEVLEESKLKKDFVISKNQHG